MSTKRTERPGGDTPPTKKQKDRIQSLPGSKCLHCDQDCTLESKALQCDLCHTWVHSECEGVSSELYELLNDVCSGTVNVSYYCELNCCNSRIKQLVAEWKLSQSPPSTEVEEIHKSLSDKYASLAQSVDELSSKIDSLISRNNTLQMEIDSASEPPSASNALASSGPPTPISPTFTILDELADRERRSKNLILYNFSESPDTKSDQSRVQELFSTVFNAEVQLMRTVRLGKRNDSKARPLLVCLNDAVVRGTILSQSGRLRKHEQFKNTYISRKWKERNTRSWSLS